MGYWAAPDPEDARAPGWKSLKEWVQEYIRYCNDWGETPRSRSAVTEQFKKMGCVSKRRSDGLWYYMEMRAVETEKKEPSEQVRLAEVAYENAVEAEKDLPF